MVSVGKSIAGGVPLGAYGRTGDLGRLLEDFTPLGDGGHATIATGGTLFGNALSMAAARAALGEILTDQAYAHATELGARLADGIEAAGHRGGRSDRPRSGDRRRHRRVREGVRRAGGRARSVGLRGPDDPAEGRAILSRRP